jgi:hypothetical protein
LHGEGAGLPDLLSHKSSWLAVLCLWLGGCLLLFQASNLLFFKSEVINVSEESFFRAEHPPGFVEQDSSFPRPRLFRSAYLQTLDTRFHDLQTAIAVRHWVHTQQPRGRSWTPHQITILERVRGDLEDPFAILRAQREGAPAVCRRFAYLFTGAMESVGMRARVVGFSRTHWKFEKDAHTLTEVWIPELQQWVVMDAMWDSMYMVNNRPASLTDVYHAVRAGRTDSVRVLHDGTLSDPLDAARLTREFQHIYLTMNNAIFDGYRVCFSCDKPIRFAHLANDYSSPYPTFRKRASVVVGGLSLLSGLNVLLLRLVRRVEGTAFPKRIVTRGTSARCPKGETA